MERTSSSLILRSQMSQGRSWSGLGQPWLEEEKALKRVLLAESELEMTEPSKNFRDRLERMYPLRWKHPNEGEDPRFWLHGRITPTTKPEELEAHFKEQIYRAKASRSAAMKRDREQTRKENLKVDQVMRALDGGTPVMKLPQ
jgi:hypothetical protein